jgi:hypothetical protein
MRRKPTARFADFMLASCVLASCLLSPAVLAQDELFGGNPLGFYVGAGIGGATVHQGFYDLGSGTFRSFSDNQRFSWKVMMGIRPITWLGAELEYLDLGSANLGPSYFVPGDSSAGEFLGASSAARAGAGFAVGYLPLPVSGMDLFGKLGVARLQMPYRYADAVPPSCSGTAPPPVTCPSSSQLFVSHHDVDTGAGYGGGAQYRFNAFAIRAEFERISTSIGDPHVVSLGFSWTP